MNNARTQLVAIGAGHAHLHLAKHARELAQHGIHLTLIDPGYFWYSGLATGVLGGMYAAEADQVDPRPLMEPAGRFVFDRVTNIDRRRRVVTRSDGTSIPFRLLSLNVGSEVNTAGIEGSEHAWPVKPIEGLWRLRNHLEQRLANNGPYRVTVIGGGPTGCEIAANLLALGRRLAAPLHIHLFTADEHLLPDAPPGAGKFMHRMLEDKGATIHLRAPIQTIGPDYVSDKAGSDWSSHLTVLATGLRPPSWLGSLGLPLGEEGGVAVGPTLQSTGDPDIFAIGDCAEFSPRALPRLGVFGVRQAPVLLNNVMALANGKPLRDYCPQRRWLSILNLGDGRALAMWGPYYLHGRICMKWKNWLDQRFLKRYRHRS
jgi:NADH dehydrogenase FAD-containing subunit